MNNNTSNKIISTVFILLILCLTFTLLQGYFPIMRRQWIFLVSTCVLGVILSSSYCTSRTFFTLLLYILVVFVNEYSGDVFWGGRLQALYELSLLLAPSIISWYAIKAKDEHLMQMTLIVFFSIIIFETIVSYIVNLSFPEVIRVISGNNFNEYSGSAYSYYRLGVANYDIVHAIPALVPMLVLGYKENRESIRKSLLFLILLLFTLTLVIISYSTTSLIFAIMGLIVSCFTRRGSIKTNKKLLVLSLIILVLFVSDSIIISIIDYISSFVNQDSSLYSKIIDIKESITYGESSGDIHTRQEKYDLSLSLFFNSPIWGTNLPVGNHSSLLDRLATLGVVGFIPYVLFLYRQLKIGNCFTKRDHHVYYFEAVSISILMLAFKDSDSWELFFTTFTIIPFMAYFLSKTMKHEK